MKLALLLPCAQGLAKQFPSGGDLYDVQLARALEQRGHEVEVLRTPPRLDASLWSARLRSGGYDAVLQDELGHAGYLRLNGKLAGRQRTIAIVHVTRAKLDPQAKSTAIERAYLASVDSVVFVSRQVKRETQRLLGIKLKSQVAHPGWDHFPSPASPLMAAGASRGRRARPRVEAARSAARAPRPASAGSTRAQQRPVHFVCAGHLLPNKGQLELVEACAELRCRYILSLAGDATRDKRYAARVQRAAAALGHRVRLRGPLTAAKLSALYQRADVFVSASFYESYGIAAAEALSSGLPVLSWSKGGLWEFLSDGENAIRIAKTSQAALVRAMTLLCEDAKLRTRLQRGATRAARALPTWRDTAMQVEKLLRRG